MSLKDFKEFAQNALTRCGVAFEIKTVQKNFEGTVTAVKGVVYLMNEKQEKVAQEMLWNMKGQAMLIGEQFDLVNEVPYDTITDEDTTVLTSIESHSMNTSH